MKNCKSMNDYFNTVKNPNFMELRNGKGVKKEFAVIQNLKDAPKYATVRLEYENKEKGCAKKKKTQDEHYFTVSRTRSKKHKEKSNRNRTYDEINNHSTSCNEERSLGSKRRRSAKEVSKEKDQTNITQYFCPYELRSKPLVKNHVTFKNSNIKEIFEYKIQEKELKPKKIDQYFVKSKRIDNVPPKTKRRRHHEEDDIGFDKVESNSKINKSRSNINIEPAQLDNRYARYLTRKVNFDEEHYESVKDLLNTKNLIENGGIRKSEEKDEFKIKLQKLSKNNEYLTTIRNRGEAAKNKRRAETQKLSTENKICFTPQNMNKIAPFPFPNLEIDEKHLDFIEAERKELNHIEPKSTDLNAIDKTFELVDKVQYPKDVSLGINLVKEVQSIPEFDVSIDIEVSNPTSAETQIRDIEMEPEVISEIKEAKNNVRTPAKVTNKTKCHFEMNKIVMTPIKSFQFKAPLPKKKHSIEEPQPQAKTKEIIHTFALRIDAKEILKEYDEIVLPKKLQLIFEIFMNIDNAINSCKRRGKIPTMSNIKPYVEQATNRSFNNEQFAQVLYVAPELYYYTWHEMQGSNNFELRIDIPENIEDIMARIGRKEFTVQVKYSPISEPMTNFLINKRKILFRSRLILYISKLHKSYLNSKGIKDYDFIAEKGWHADFDEENIIDIPPK